MAPRDVMLCSLVQWYSTWGTQRHLRAYVKLKKNLLFHDKHWIIRAIFRVSHKRPGCKDMRFGSIIFSLSLLYAILIWVASFILSHTVRWNMTENYWAGLTFSLIPFFTSFNHAMKLLQNTVVAINKQTHSVILPRSLTIAAAVI
jgi:hypothetical protein